MTRGRKPKPTALKLLTGNPGKRPINKREPKPTPKAPGMPSTLSQEAKAEWRRVIAELDRIGIVTRVDRGALDAYCRAYARMVQADRHVQQFGVVLLEETGHSFDGTAIFVRPVKNPNCQVFKECAAIVRAFAAEFGLTPSARTRIEVPKADDADLATLLGPRSSGRPS